MTKYKVIASYVVECYCYVEAESKDEAWDKAYHIDGSDYTRRQDFDGDWQIERIEEAD